MSATIDTTTGSSIGLIRALAYSLSTDKGVVDQAYTRFCLISKSMD